MEDLVSDPTFRIFVAGFAASCEGYNIEYMAEGLAPRYFGQELDLQEITLDGFIAQCTAEPKFVRLFNDYLQGPP